MKAIAVPKNIEPSICCRVELGLSIAIALIDCTGSGELVDPAGVEMKVTRMELEA